LIGLDWIGFWIWIGFGFGFGLNGQERKLSAAAVANLLIFDFWIFGFFVLFF
jgi:hypothetical protein